MSPYEYLQALRHLPKDIARIGRLMRRHGMAALWLLLQVALWPISGPLWLLHEFRHTRIDDTAVYAWMWVGGLGIWCALVSMSWVIWVS